MAASEENLVAERNYNKFLKVANDAFSHRSANKYIEKHSYTYSPPFGARNEGLEIDVLVPKAFPRVKSPMMSRFPPPDYDVYKTVTKCDFRWTSPVPTSRSSNSTPSKSTPKDAHAAGMQRAHCNRLAKPIVDDEGRIAPTRKRNYPTQRINRFIEQRKGTSSQGWLPTY